MTVVLTSNLLLLAHGCGPDVRDEIEWAVGEYSNVGYIGPSANVDNRFTFERFLIMEGGTGWLLLERCGTIVSQQGFEWQALDENSVNLLPVEADVFTGTYTSIVAKKATACTTTGDESLAAYPTLRFSNGATENGQESLIFRTKPCAIPIAAPSPCPDGNECGPGPCELSWCDDEAPEPCELDD